MERECEEAGIDYATVGSLFMLLVSAGVLGVLVWRSFGLSFSQTRRFARYTFGETYEWPLAILINFGPQAALLYRSLTYSRRQRQAALALVLLLNGLDIATNILGHNLTQFPSAQPEIPPMLAQLSAATVIGVSILITWSEEAILWLLIAALHMAYRVSRDVGVPLPRWLAARYRPKL